jgi:hypothetical protein
MAVGKFSSREGHVGKGHYRGGGTIIGPHTPEWFGHGDDAAQQPEGKARQTFVPDKFRKAETLWQEAFEPPAPAPVAATKRRELSTREAAEISNLRIAVKGSKQQLAAATARLKADLEALNNRLAELGQPQEE